MNDDLNLVEIAMRVGMSCAHGRDGGGHFHDHKICRLGRTTGDVVSRAAIARRFRLFAQCQADHRLHPGGVLEIGFDGPRICEAI
jgi:hypothetical protein